MGLFLCLAISITIKANNINIAYFYVITVSFYGFMRILDKANATTQPTRP